MQREGQARQGCLSVCAQGLCKDAKPTKHTLTLILRKARGIVRFLEGLVRGEGWCGNPSGSRPNFFGRQHLTFDKGGKGDGAKQGKGVGGFRGIVRFCEGWMRNEGLLTEVSEKRKGYGKCDNPSKFAMLCTATKKIGYCAVPD